MRAGPMAPRPRLVEATMSGANETAVCDVLAHPCATCGCRAGLHSTPGCKGCGEKTHWYRPARSATPPSEPAPRDEQRLAWLAKSSQEALVAADELLEGAARLLKWVVSDYDPGNARMKFDVPGWLARYEDWKRGER